MTTAALVAALETYTQPLVHRRPSHKRLPPGILDVIKIAAQDEESICRAEAEFSLKREILIESATFYLQKLLLDGGDSPYRLLCLEDGASEQDVAMHKRWLLKWLHPDRNKNKWETVLFTRVSQAATLIGQREVEIENFEFKTAVGSQRVSGSKAKPRSDRGRDIHQPASRRKIVFFWREIFFRNAIRALILLAVTSFAIILYKFLSTR